MSHLKEVQNSFSEYLGSESTNSSDPRLHDFVEEKFLHRLSVYKNNFTLNANETLAQVFPITEMILGRAHFLDCSSQYARSFVALSPRREDWPNAFSDFLMGTSELAQLPFLGDLAKFELELFHAARRPHQAGLSVADFVELASGDGESLATLRLIPSAGLLSSDYRIDQLYEVHMSGEIEELPHFQVVKQSCHLIIFQKRNIPLYASVSEAEFAVLNRLHKHDGWQESQMADFSDELLRQTLSQCLALEVLTAETSSPQG